MPDDNKPLECAPPDPDALRRRRATQIGLIVVCAFVLAAIVCGVVSERSWSRIAVLPVKCAANLRSIGQAIQLYCQDYRAYPPDLHAVLSTQDIGPEEFVCPVSPDTPARGATAFGSPGTCSYIYVGFSLPLDAKPQCVVAIEDPVNHDMQGGNVLYADGHVERVSIWYLVQVLTDLQSGLNPPSSATSLTTGQVQKLYDTQLKPLMPQLKSGTLRFPATAPTTRP